MKQKNVNSKKEKGDLVGPLLTGIYMMFLFLSLAIFVKTIFIQTGISKVVKPEYEHWFMPNDRRVKISPVRGRILTYDGRPLAITVPYYDIYMDCTVQKQAYIDMDQKEMKEREARIAKGKPVPDTLKRSGAKNEALWQRRADTLATKLAELFGDKPAAEYRKMILGGRENGKTNVLIHKNVGRQEYLKLKTFPLFDLHPYKGGLKVEQHDEREYPYDTLARRTIGTMRANSRRGLEYSFDHDLHGYDGYEWQRITEHSTYVHDYDSVFKAAVNGCDVRTTINIDFQGIADRALRRQIDANKEIRGGIAVILEVETGAVRAMVNLVRDTIPGSALRERDNLVLTQLGEQGSVMKTVTMTSLLEDGYITLDQKIPCNNGMIPGLPKDNHVNGNGTISVLHGFEISSNYVFAKLAQMYYSKNEQQYYDHIFAYGLGDSFAFDIEGLRKPQVNLPGTSGHSGTTLLTNAYGYGITITPLHLAMFYNAIANKGRMMKPYLVESVEKDGKVVRKLGPAFMNNICSRATADTVSRALRAVVTNGTGKANLSKASLHVAGKTGTARSVLMEDEGRMPSNPYQDKWGRRKFQGTFVGFFPYENPKYTVLVTVYSYPSHAEFYGGNLPAKAVNEMVNQIYAIDEGWSEVYVAQADVPEMGRELRDCPAGKVPDLSGMGLSDALWEIESRSLKCVYSGNGHVCSQKPSAGSAIKEGQTIEIVLK